MNLRLNCTASFAVVILITARARAVSHYLSNLYPRAVLDPLGACTSIRVVAPIERVLPVNFGFSRFGLPQFSVWCIWIVCPVFKSLKPRKPVIRRILSTRIYREEFDPRLPDRYIIFHVRADLHFTKPRTVTAAIVSTEVGCFECAAVAYVSDRRGAIGDAYRLDEGERGGFWAKRRTGLQIFVHLRIEADTYLGRRSDITCHIPTLKSKNVLTVDSLNTKKARSSLGVSKPLPSNDGLFVNNRSVGVRLQFYLERTEGTAYIPFGVCMDIRRTSYTLLPCFRCYRLCTNPIYNVVTRPDPITS